MELPLDTPLAQIEAHLRRQLAESGAACVEVEALAEAICARCHEEVRVWVENFARAERATAEEDSTQTFFVLKGSSARAGGQSAFAPHSEGL